MEPTNNQTPPITPEPTPSPVAPSAPAMPQTPLTPPPFESQAVPTPVDAPPPMNGGPMGGAPKSSSPVGMIIAVIIVALIGASGIGAYVLYQNKIAAANKKATTDYVVKEQPTTIPTVTTEPQPTLPPGLNEPVATDATGIDNEIKILDQTATSTDSTTLGTEEIKNITQ